ncbi:MAG TPA: hypothetical protein PKD83_08670 [Ignavibacteria bacterium]|nr:hypothetical protein [Ignavibacteria bacterium]
MNISLFYSTDTWLISLILFLLMLIAIYSGVKLAKLTKVSQSQDEADNNFNNAIYGIMGLLLAFTFSMAGSRFDSRKKVIVQEANCIGTAILRADMYPDSVRVLFREDFKKYLEERINYFDAHRDIAKVMESLNSAEIYSANLWERATSLSKNPVFFAQTNQMIPALNEMFDIANERLNDELYKLPDAIIGMLFIVILFASFLLGFSSISKGKFEWYTPYYFSFIVVMIFYIILDLDKPRSGLINMDESQKSITALREMFK